MARLTGLEPATPGVTGRHSNQLSYNRAMKGHISKHKAGVNWQNPPPVASARFPSPRCFAGAKEGPCNDLGQALG